jgi:O-antigen/teichoic acid export membrane protein
LLVLLNYVINLIANVYSLSAFIKNYSSISSRNSGIGKIIYALIIFVVIYSNTIKVYSTVVASVVSSIFILLTSIYYAKKITPELKINIKCFNFNKVKTLLSSGIWNSINNIGNLLNSGLDLLLSNQLLSSVAMGEISIVKQISNIVTSVSFMISNAFRAKQLEAYSKNNIQKLVDYLVIAMKCMGIIGGVLVAGFVALGKQFYMTWLPSQDAQLLYRLTVIVMVGEVLVIVVRPLYYVNTLTDKLKIVCWMTILNGILNVIGMIVLIKLFDWKSYAIVVTTMVLNFIQALIVTPILESYFLKLKDKFIFSKIVIRYLLITTLCTLIIYAISLLLNTGAGWKNLIFNAIILGGVGFIIMVLGELEPHEIKRILKVKK